MFATGVCPVGGECPSRGPSWAGRRAAGPGSWGSAWWGWGSPSPARATSSSGEPPSQPRPRPSHQLLPLQRQARQQDHLQAEARLPPHLQEPGGGGCRFKHATQFDTQTHGWGSREGWINCELWSMDDDNKASRYHIPQWPRWWCPAPAPSRARCWPPTCWPPPTPTPWSSSSSPRSPPSPRSLTMVRILRI